MILEIFTNHASSLYIYNLLQLDATSRQVTVRMSHQQSKSGSGELSSSDLTRRSVLKVSGGAISAGAIPQVVSGQDVEMVKVPRILGRGGVGVHARPEAMVRTQEPGRACP